MNVLGIDPSYTATGLGHRRWTDTLRPPPGVQALPDGPIRTLRRRRAIRAQLKDYLTNRGRTGVAIEGMYPSTDRGVLDRAALLGDIIDVVESHTEGAIVIVAPKSVKQFATGDGNADKADMVAAYAEHGPNANLDDNEADAWWLAAFAHELLGDPMVRDRTPHMRKALDPYLQAVVTRRVKGDKADPWIRRHNAAEHAARLLTAR